MPKECSLCDSLQKAQIEQNEGAGDVAEQEGGKGDTDHESGMPTIHNV